MKTMNEHVLREAQVADIPALQFIRNAVQENRLSDPALVKNADVEDYITRRGKGWVGYDGNTAAQLKTGADVFFLTSRTIFLNEKAG